MNMRSVRAATCCCSLSVWALRHFPRGETHVADSWQFANTLSVFCTNTFVDDSCLLSCFHKVFKMLEDRFEASQTAWRSPVSLTGCVHISTVCEGEGWTMRPQRTHVKVEPHRTELFTSRKTETCSCHLPAVQFPADLKKSSILSSSAWWGNV